jgi:hypothetical protein
MAGEIGIGSGFEAGEEGGGGGEVAFADAEEMALIADERRRAPAVR